MRELQSAPPQCLKCGRTMQIARFRCEPCDLSVDGSFELPPLAGLSLEDQILVTAFVREHGNIKKMEALFGISYPTVKNRLNAIGERLDTAHEAPNVRGAILERLAKGKISVADAERLLEQMQTPIESRTDAAGEDGEAGTASPTAKGNGTKAGAKLPKFLRVVVDGVAGEHINVRVPISLVRTGVRLGALLPKQARKAVEAQGVDLSGLSELDADELACALPELEVNVDEVDGGRLRIFCE